jgi:hypothetical protein
MGAGTMPAKVSALSPMARLMAHPEHLAAESGF